MIIVVVDFYLAIGVDGTLKRINSKYAKGAQPAGWKSIIVLNMQKNETSGWLESETGFTDRY